MIGRILPPFRSPDQGCGWLPVVWLRIGDTEGATEVKSLVRTIAQVGFKDK
jgi:hypothetical protein